ncbi:MAG: GAF domain-containing protein, partial [Anaerolineae bacterium]|nr:GAF domain-containing protein [Anaerolineae bacterium]
MKATVVTRNFSVNLIVILAVGVVIALIGLAMFFASQLVNDTVVDQFKSQELQLASSLSQQTETYFNSLIADIAYLSAQPEINTASSDRLREEALALLAEHGTARDGIIRSIAVFSYRGEPRYAWPEPLAAVIEAGERFPYALDSQLVAQTKDGTYVPIETQLVRASHRDYPDQGTFLLITPVYTDLRKTDFLVYDLDLDVLFSQLMGFVELDARGQLWVLNRDEVLFQANATIPIESLLAKISLASLVSFREPVIEDYTAEGDDRLAVIAPITTQGRDFAVILSRDVDTALNRVEFDLRQIFVLAGVAILLITVLAGVAWSLNVRAARRHLVEVQRRQTARTLLEVSRALNSTLNLADVLRSIMAELSHIVPYDSAAVLLLDRSKLVVAAHRGSDVDEHQATEFDLDEAQAANQVLQTGRPLVIQDTTQDERWQSTATSRIRAWMGIPLRVRDQTVGVLNINSHQVGHFTAEQIELAAAFADQASVALQNARLHEVEVKQIEQELTIARDIQ